MQEAQCLSYKKYDMIMVVINKIKIQTYDTEHKFEGTVKNCTVFSILLQAKHLKIAMSVLKIQEDE